jgi:hypothetical protein
MTGMESYCISLCDICFATCYMGWFVFVDGLTTATGEQEIKSVIGRMMHCIARGSYRVASYSRGNMRILCT